MTPEAQKLIESAARYDWEEMGMYTDKTGIYIEYDDLIRIVEELTKWNKIEQNKAEMRQILFEELKEMADFCSFGQSKFNNKIDAILQRLFELWEPSLPSSLKELLSFIDGDRVEINFYGNDGFDSQEKIDGKKHLKNYIVNAWEESKQTPDQMAEKFYPLDKGEIWTETMNKRKAWINSHKGNIEQSEDSGQMELKQIIKAEHVKIMIDFPDENWQDFEELYSGAGGIFLRRVIGLFPSSRSQEDSVNSDMMDALKMAQILLAENLPSIRELGNTKLEKMTASPSCNQSDYNAKASELHGENQYASNLLKKISTFITNAEK